MTFTDPIRPVAFNWLARQMSVHGDVLPRALLERRFRRALCQMGECDSDRLLT